MLRFAHRLVGDGAAEDVLQEALASAWRSRRRFDPDRGQPRAWLLAIVANKAKNHRSRLSLAPAVSGESGAEAPAEQSTVASLDVSDALRHLTGRQRTAVALYYYLGMSTAECAQVMACSDGTVKSTLSAARHRLRGILGEDYR